MDSAFTSSSSALDFFPFSAIALHYTTPHTQRSTPTKTRRQKSAIKKVHVISTEATDRFSVRRVVERPLYFAVARYSLIPDPYSLPFPHPLY